MVGPRRRLGPRLAVLWFILTTALLVWPIYPWLGNRVHPRVLGLPWSLCWVLGVIALNFVALLLLYRFRIVDEREHEWIERATDAEPPLEPSEPSLGEEP